MVFFLHKHNYIIIFISLNIKYFSLSIFKEEFSLLLLSDPLLSINRSEVNLTGVVNGPKIMGLANFCQISHLTI